MGRLREEVTDPWGLLVAGVAGGLAWAAVGPVALGVGVGAAVYGVKVATGALLRGGDRPDRTPPPARPAAGTAAAFWLGRAERAVKALDDMVPGSGSTPTDVATRRAAEEADAVLEAVRRLGGQAVAVAQALSTAEAAGLDEEAARLRQVATQRPDDDSARRSADAVADRVAVRDRLRAAAQALDGRLQSSALGLEGLVARLAELRATAAAVGEVDPSAGDLAALTTEVEALRVGLADVEQVARTALGSPG